MADTVLTDAELWAAFKVLHCLPVGSTADLWESARAVEAAVLAKFRSGLTEARCISADLVPRERAEAEARRRERAAWDDCYAWGARHGPGIESGAETIKCRRERDRRYPLPTRPRTVELSSGEKVTATLREVRAADMPDALYIRLNATSVLTAADIAALAELIKSPTEPAE